MSHRKARIAALRSSQRHEQAQPVSQPDDLTPLAKAEARRATTAAETREFGTTPATPVTRRLPGTGAVRVILDGGGNVIGMERR